MSSKRSNFLPAALGGRMIYAHSGINQTRNWSQLHLGELSTRIHKQARGTKTIRQADGEAWQLHPDSGKTMYGQYRQNFASFEKDPATYGVMLDNGYPSKDIIKAIAPPRPRRRGKRVRLR
jgi:hypothetical protein